MENNINIAGDNFRVVYDYSPPEEHWGAEIEVLEVYFEDEKEPTDDYPEDIALYLKEEFH